MSFIYSGSWWWTGKPGVQQSMGSQRVGHDWATELNWFNLLLASYNFDDFGIRIKVSLLRAFPIILGNSTNISEATTFVSQFYTFSTQISFFLFPVPFWHILSWWLSNTESAFSAEDPGLIPGLRRSFGVGNGNPLQHFCLENPIDRGTWWATVHRVEELDMTEVT